MLVLNQFSLMFSNYYWGNPWYSSKIEYLQSQDVKLPNTCFFGSSRIYRQIDPRIFDEYYNKNSNYTRKSYNLGSPATFCPETYYLYERFIKTEIANNVDLVFMELMSVNMISKDLMLEERTTYWQNLSDLKFIYASFKNNKTLSLNEKYKGLKDYSICYAYNLFDFKHLKNSLLFEYKEDLVYNGPYNNGYNSLDNNLKTTKDDNVRNDLIARRKLFLTDSTVFNDRVLNLANYHKLTNNKFDEVNLNRVLNLIDVSKRNGIELVFVLPQIVLDENLIGLSKMIPKKNFIDLSNPEKFPQLYEKENIFDVGHLNCKGANIFTELLVEQYFENKKSDMN